MFISFSKLDSWTNGIGVSDSKAGSDKDGGDSGVFDWYINGKYVKFDI